ncbi:MAG: hypothetical protein AAB848_01260, partial [Patescibacteria group bacterium]
MSPEAVRLPEQDILSAVMRRQIVTHATPYLSLVAKENPLFRCGDAVQGLVRTYRTEVRNLLSSLSHGKMSISDFSTAIDDMLGRIRESVGDDMSAFSEIEMAVHSMREHIDTVCAMARGFISPPPENVGNLRWADAELLRQVEEARAIVTSKAAVQAAQTAAAASSGLNVPAATVPAPGAP